MPVFSTPSEPPKLRFVVGTFDTWLQLGKAMDDLRKRGVAPENMSCLALQRVHTGRTDASSATLEAIRKFSFPDSQEAISCTRGLVAECLDERLRAGATSLQSALAHWLIPRHAAHFHKAVAMGQILVWVQVFNPEDERHANQSLLANSSNGVGVHDLVPRVA